MLDSYLTLIALLAASAGMLAGIGTILCLCLSCKSDKRKDDDSDA